MIQIIKPDINFDFVGRRNIAFGLSLVLIIASILSLIVHGGPKQGIDFVGSAEILIRTNKPISIETVKATLQDLELKGSVQQYGEKTGDYYRIVINAEQAEGQDLTKRIQKHLDNYWVNIFEYLGELCLNRFVLILLDRV